MTTTNKPRYFLPDEPTDGYCHDCGERTLYGASSPVTGRPGKVRCPDCHHENEQAIAALDARDCRNINFYDGGDFNYGRGR